MAVRAKHAFTSPVADDGTADEVGPSEWNADHAVQLTGPALVGRIAASDGDSEEVPLGNGLAFNGAALQSNRIPPNVQNATYTLVAADDGRAVVKNNTTAYTWTIPPEATYDFPDGTCIMLVNDGSSGNVTVARGTSVALLNGTSDANLTLGPGQAVTIWKTATANRWRVL